MTENVVTMSAESLRVRTEQHGNELVLVLDDDVTRVELVGARLELAGLGCQRLATTADQHALLLYRRAGLPVAGLNVPSFGQPDPGAP